MTTHRRSSLSFFVLLAAAGCATAPETAEGKSELQQKAATALANAETSDSSLGTALRQAVGYAVFPNVGKGGVGVGGAYGKGVLYENGHVVGYCDLTQGSIGLQLGGQTYTEIIVFSTPDALARFKSGRVEFDAQAGAVAVKSGAAANAKYTDGVAVFTTNEAGLMVEASIGGQKFNYQPA